MGATIYISVRDSDRMSDEYSLMLALDRQLDRLCQRLKVAKLSDFYDGSEMAAEFLDEVEDMEEKQIAQQEELAEQWFDPAPALKAVRAIVACLEQNFDALGFQPDASRAHWPENLLDELRECAAILDDAAAKGRQFRFLLVP